MPVVTPSLEIACELLTEAGFPVRAEQIHIDVREDRWVVHLADDRLAWFASSPGGYTRLATERRVLKVIAASCSFGVPRILYEDPLGTFDVRAMIAGNAGPFEVLARVTEDPGMSRRIGSQVGAMLAEQHTRISSRDVAAWLPATPAWPESRAWIMERLPTVVDDPKLLPDAAHLMELYEGIPVGECERALVHTDVGFHNMGIDAASGQVFGLFDYGDAAWADRHHDFRYLMFDLGRWELFDAAVEAYREGGGGDIEKRRVLLYNAACALTFLAYRIGTKAEDRSCGRTLSEDMRWSTEVVAAALMGYEGGKSSSAVPDITRST